MDHDMTKSINILDLAGKAFDVIDSIQSTIKHHMTRLWKPEGEVTSFVNTRRALPVTWTDCSWSVEISMRPPICPTEGVPALPASCTEVER
jgi:hypothetical protein